MDISNALPIFDTLSQETRLKAFRLLVQAGPSGMPAGAISDALGTPHNTLSFHLNHLAGAGIVHSKKAGRSVIYSANFQAIQDLICFMVEDCCSKAFTSIEKDPNSKHSTIKLNPCCPTSVNE